jgi:signal transduction histidine kinase
LDPVPGTASSATPWERLFLECDKEGRILWMNDRAKRRLGPVESLFTALPGPHLNEISRLLQSTSGGRQRPLLSSFQCGERRVPVQLVQLLALDGRVVLSAEVRARASDAVRPQHELLEVLLQWQSKATRNYFRLRRAHELLASRRRPSRSAGAAVADALEMERTRVARELHSGAGQTLAGIKVNLELIAARMPEAPEPLRRSLGRIGELANEALAEIRSISQRLYPPDWQRLNLSAAVEWLWVTTGIPEKFHATLELDPLESDIPDAVRFTVYRAAQEGLANVLRHSGATQLKLHLGQRDDHITLILEDNGSGFDARESLSDASSTPLRGIGLRAMRDEVFSLGGSFQLTSGPGGTRMEITLPIAENR